MLYAIYVTCISQRFTLHECTHPILCILYSSLKDLDTLPKR